MSVSTLYLNNLGSRWILVDRAKREKVNKVEFERDGMTHIRRAVHFGQFGNWSYARVSYKGKMTDVLEFKLCD